MKDRQNTIISILNELVSTANEIMGMVKTDGSQEDTQNKNNTS